MFIYVHETEPQDTCGGLVTHLSDDAAEHLIDAINIAIDTTVPGHLRAPLEGLQNNLAKRLARGTFARYQRIWGDSQ